MTNCSDRLLAVSIPAKGFQDQGVAHREQVIKRSSYHKILEWNHLENLSVTFVSSSFHSG